MREIDNKEKKKILVLQLAGIGDLAMATPALKALRNSFKESFIGLSVISRSAELIKGSPYIDGIFVFDVKFPLIRLFTIASLIRIFNMVRILRKERFDMLINLQEIASFRGMVLMGILVWLIGAHHTVGRDMDGRGFFFNRRIKESSQKHRHEVEMNLEVVRSLGAQIDNVELELPVFDEDRLFVSGFLARHNINSKDLLFGFNPGAFHPYKRWFKTRWSQLADRLIKEYSGKIVVVGPPKDKKIIGEIVNSLETKSVVGVTDLNLKQLTALIERLNLFITNDTGPMHIAAAVQTPLVVLTGPGDLYRYSPYTSGGKCLIIKKKVDCEYPCYKFSCKKRKCMELITVEDVMKAVGEIFG